MAPDDVERVIRVNRLAQGLQPLSEGASWFAALPTEDQLAVLRLVAEFAGQAGAREADVAPAVERSGTKPTYTPSVLLSRGRLKEQLAKVLALPAREYGRAFPLLIALLGIADGRRRTTACATGCAHWWHRDLSDEEVLSALRGPR